MDFMEFIATGMNNQSGMNNQRTAATCFLSEKTAKKQINRIFAKVHSTSPAKATAKWPGRAPGSPPGRS